MPTLFITTSELISLHRICAGDQCATSKVWFEEFMGYKLTPCEIEIKHYGTVCHSWLIHFDTEAELIEFKLRWL